MNRLNVSITGFEAAQGGHYVPAWPEVFITLMIVAMVFAAYALAVRYLDVYPEVTKRRNGRQSPHPATTAAALPAGKRFRTVAATSERRAPPRSHLPQLTGDPVPYPRRRGRPPRPAAVAIPPASGQGGWRHFSRFSVTGAAPHAMAGSCPTLSHAFEEEANPCA